MEFPLWTQSICVNARNLIDRCFLYDLLIQHSSRSACTKLTCWLDYARFLLSICSDLWSGCMTINIYHATFIMICLWGVSMSPCSLILQCISPSLSKDMLFLDQFVVLGWQCASIHFAFQYVLESLSANSYIMEVPLLHITNIPSCSYFYHSTRKQAAAHPLEVGCSFCKV